MSRREDLILRVLRGSGETSDTMGCTTLWSALFTQVPIFCVDFITRQTVKTVKADLSLKIATRRDILGYGQCLEEEVGEMEATHLP